MFNRKKLTAFAATAVAALALVGVGTGAQWSDSVDATQNISTGTVDLVISDYWGTSAPVYSDGTHIVYDLSNAGSVFDEQHTVKITNEGTLPVHNFQYSVAASGDPELTSNVRALVLPQQQWWGWFMPVDWWLLQPQPVYTVDSTLNPGESTYVDLWFQPKDYLFDGLPLPNEAQGKTLTFTMTVDAVEGTGVAGFKAATNAPPMEKFTYDPDRMRIAE